ncbi:54S ribosomal protein L33, mitochondrial [Sphaceloma murrayae]|uniref:Large ribosomal subunit protein uL30m n=1 Tax=Sphaceloma murrayae TaxID=2082308 RepID=A0A2K1QNV9_9PEZI|nr:54S ribosomal protein L33, mitochondrial [Sphaceloma murrayae]
MAFFRITLLRSAIGLPKKYAGTLRALGLTKRMKTVYLPVNHDIAGQIFSVKELVDVQEVASKLTSKTMKELRKPDPGFYVEQKAGETALSDEVLTTWMGVLTLRAMNAVEGGLSKLSAFSIGNKGDCNEH